ncbi:hypothetical protein GQ55_2G213900 [Panicum hallii var. hallii]|uniref:Reverse transcriptase zinc-binding domain-containing protein n=1 Tax=Panicum hallii var. hallii TaxID=1504633 RepID=A0A2T7ER11_9POAL|nr:hypothetical protein GQ55_2G213900 [Panicum hallii var. hallii]
MNIPPKVAADMAATLGCPISSSPQPYLGLPLSATKIRLCDLQPLLTRFDEYFAGWRGSLLNQGVERFLFALCFLASLFTQCAPSSLRMLSSCLTPNAALSFGRAILLASVLTAKLRGRRGITDFHTHNKCLLQKFLNKLLAPSSAPCHVWFRSKYGWALNTNFGDFRRSDTAVWRGILEGLADFRSATSVLVGSGNTTFFWLDHWLGDGPLAASFPALFSHCLR